MKNVVGSSWKVTRTVKKEVFDHPPVLISLKQDKQKRYKIRKLHIQSYYFKQVNFEGFYAELSNVCWSSVTQVTEVDDTCLEYKGVTLTSALDIVNSFADFIHSL